MIDAPPDARPTLGQLQALRAELGPLVFATPAQEILFDSRAQEVLYSGAMGAGKSRILCEKAWWLAKRYPGCTVGLFRKVAASLPATTMRTFIRDVMDRSLIEARNLTQGWYQLTNGSRIYFLGLDPDPITGVPSKIGSLELGWAGVDEAVELSEGDWTMLMGRLRDPRVPYHQLAAATNPGPPTHWLKRRFTPSTPDRVYLHATAYDNTQLPDDYRRIVEALPDNAVGRRLGRGEWAAVEGAIWTLPLESVKAPTPNPKRVVAGLDWGFVHPLALEVLYQSGSGRLGVAAELYATGRGVDQLVETWLDDSGQAHPGIAQLLELHQVTTVACDPSEPGLMAQLQRGLAQHRLTHQGEVDQVRRNGGTADDCRLTAKLVAADNSVALGLQAVDRAIRAGLTVDPACTGLLGEIPGYTWQPQRGGGYREVPVDVGDDACDALRYAVMQLEGSPANPWSILAGQSAGGVA